MRKHRKITGMLIAAILVLAMLCPFIFITVEANHDCVGKNCSICQQITACENLIQNLGNAGVVAAAAIATGYLLCCCITMKQETESRLTLVSLKVKLSN